MAVNGYDGLIPGADKEAWKAAAAEISSESLAIEGHPVMEAWERPYMAALAAVATKNGGRVLEVGFGLGIASAAIQEAAIEEHVIIEANGDVFRRLSRFAATAGRPVRPIDGLWEEVLPRLEAGSFDGILYDTYPLNRESQHRHQFDFLGRARRLLRPAGVATYCNLTSLGVLRGRYPSWERLFEETQRPRLLAAGYRPQEIAPFEVVPVRPPASCRYYQHDTAMVPILVRGGAGSGGGRPPALLQSPAGQPGDKP